MNAPTQNSHINATPPKSVSPGLGSSPPEPPSPIAPLPRRPSGLRQASGFGSLSRETSPAPPSNGDAYHLSENADSKTGKSGAIIRRLGNDKDRLQRLLNDETMQRRQAEQDAEIARGTVEKLRDENANLVHAHDADLLIIKRRDRQVEDLKAELMQEREKSHGHHQAAQRLISERDEAMEQCSRETTLARNQAKHATVHAEVLEQSHKQLKIEYQQRFETMLRRLRQLETERDEERKKVARLDVVVEQMSQQVERSNKINVQMGEEMERYKDDSQRNMKQLMEEIRSREAVEAQLREEATRVMGEARWLINVGKNAAQRGGLI